MTRTSKAIRKPATYGGTLTTGMVAAVCKVAPRTVSKWFDKGMLKGHRIPGSRDRRVPRENLIEFLKQNGMPVPSELKDEFKMISFGVNDLDRKLYTHDALTPFDTLFDLGFYLGKKPQIAIALLGTGQGSGALRIVFDRIKSINQYTQVVLVMEPGDKVPPDINETIIYLPTDWSETVTQMILDYHAPPQAIRSYSHVMKETHDIRQQVKTTTLQ